MSVDFLLTSAYKELCDDALAGYNLLQIKKKIMKNTKLLKLIEEENDHMKKRNYDYAFRFQLNKGFTHLPYAIHPNSKLCIFRCGARHLDFMNAKTNKKIRREFTSFLKKMIERAEETYTARRSIKDDEQQAHRNDYLKERITCKCGCLITRRGEQVHLRSNKHKKNMLGPSGEKITIKVKRPINKIEST